MFSLRHWFSKKSRIWRRTAIALCCLVGIGLSFLPTVATAQSGVQQGEDQIIREFSLPRPAAEPPVYRPPAAQPRRRNESSGAAPRRRTQPEAAPAPRQRSELRPAVAPRPVAPRPVAPRPAASRPAPQPEPALPETAATPASTSPNSQYVLEFNRSPIVGNRLKLQGVYPQARIGFTRPRNWEVKSAKALIRFQHSPTLLADRSVLMVRVNDTSIGSVPLNRPQSQIGQVLFNIPGNLIQDYNEISLMAEQQTSDTCTNPADLTLWSEVLPDSKITFDYQPQAIPLDFGSYPYPFFDDLNLDPNRITYLRPNAYSEAWLTATARHEAAIARQADFRPLETRMIESLDQADITDRLVMIGTPGEQPALRELDLPFRLQGGNVLDGSGNALPGDVGVLMLTTTETADGNVPVLVATGNAPEGVIKAVQFLVQNDREIGTGNSILVTTIDEVSSPDPRQWKGFLPNANSFQLSDLQNSNHQSFQETTVQGTNAPPIQIPFKALPDDRFSRGSTMKLNYSYSPQVNPRTSALEVRLDGTTIASKRLGGWFANASKRESFNVNLPEALIQPDSNLEVQFVLNPRESASCGVETDQSLYGTVHTDTTFNLNRDNVVELPDLKLLKAGYPIASPQDLSAAAIVLPDSPNDTDVDTLLAFSERMGRLTQADSVKLNVYRAGTLPAEVRNQSQLVGIGTRDRFPLPEALSSNSGGLNLNSAFARQRQQSAIQTLGDSQGIIKQVVLPEGDRTVLALTAQSEAGLREIQTVFDRDPLFSQLRGDTVLVRRTEENPSQYDATGYALEFLQQSTPRRIVNTGFFSRLSIFLQDFWFLIPTGIILTALLLYVFSQLYLNRVARSSGDLK